MPARSVPRSRTADRTPPLTDPHRRPTCRRARERAPTSAASTCRRPGRPMLPLLSRKPRCRPSLPRPFSTRRASSSKAIRSATSMRSPRCGPSPRSSSTSSTASRPRRVTRGCACSRIAGCGRCWAMATGRFARRRRAVMSATSASPISTGSSSRRFAVCRKPAGLATWAHGKGYATEALAAALAWLDGQQRFERSVCVIAPTNVASIRVAEKAGYGEPQRIRFNDADSLLFSRRSR